MRAHFLLPFTIALAVPVASWVSGCGGDDTNPTSSSSVASTTSSGAGGNGSGGNGSGGEGGGAQVVPGEKCPGIGVSLELDAPAITISGTTEGASDDLSAACGGSNAPDLVYAITLPADGTFKAKAIAPAGSKMNPAIYLRSACEDDSSNIQCADYGTGPAELIASELKAGTYYVIVDGGSGTSGAFDLTLSLTTPMCGDHVLNAGEACDPPGPGCDATCQPMAAMASQDKCPGGGNTFQIPDTGMVIMDQYTTGFADNYSPMSCANPGTAGPDRVYQLIPDIDGMMTVKIGYDADGTTATCDSDPENTGCFDRVLYVRTTCNDMASEIACSNEGAYAAESITFPVMNLNQYYVFVDGGSANSFGTYSLVVSIQP